MLPMGSLTGMTKGPKWEERMNQIRELGSQFESLLIPKLHSCLSGVTYYLDQLNIFKSEKAELEA
jgi:hypothetical protein